MATNQELIDYYADLLVIQYIAKAKAYATIQALVTPVVMPQTTVQEITFPVAPSSGTFVLSYDSGDSAAISWNSTGAAIQTILQAVTGLDDVTVSGEIADLSLVVTFTGVAPPALLLELGANSLMESGSPVIPTILETSETLPLAVQNAFNLTGANPAQGAQLDVLGKYAGVARSGYSFTGPVTLDDADFLSLIQIAVIRNNSGSSLSVIQDLINQFFPGAMLVFDYQDMTLSYLVSTSVGSLSLIQLFILEGLLPKPMGVRLRLVIYGPIINNFFGFRTYLLPAFNAAPFNSYTDYQTGRPWLSYANAIS